eukprot:TRINITY_DN10038_c0_g1_i1.p1 TRINITY_DN10038_c0_g1~~TRINITY_DN10038_c0_g1_i1.p1  ORF type:complete len:505 (-),score=118.78 TRINITY_DN10038_c0_g1_i1:50-1564(-)
MCSSMAATALVPCTRVHKPVRQISDQQRRRDFALERQRQARRDLQAYARRLALATLDASDEDDPAEAPQCARGGEVSSGASDASMGDEENMETQAGDPSQRQRRQKHGSRSARAKNGDDQKEELMTEAGENDMCDSVSWSFLEASKLRGWKAREFFSQQLMNPEWMIDVPPRLETDWYVLARPEGKRCLVVSSNGMTISRLRNGRVLHRFPSFLPNGARTRDVAAASHVYCILDCVFHEADQTYYVIDLMSWRGYSLYDCSYEFRLFWLTSKLPTDCNACSPPSPFHRFRFALIPTYVASTAGLQAAYHETFPYIRDGLLFYNRHGHYSLRLTPLVLQWKDQNSSRYFLDTDSQGSVPMLQQVVLQLEEGGVLVTSDDPPAALSSVPREFMEQHQPPLRAGQLLRFTLPSDAQLHVVDGRLLCIAALNFVAVASGRRGGADSCTKILFQYSARHQQLSFDSVLSGAASDADGSSSTMTIMHICDSDMAEMPESSMTKDASIVAL